MAPSDRAIRAARIRVKVILATMFVAAMGLSIWRHDWRLAAFVTFAGLMLLLSYYIRWRKGRNA